MLKKLNDITINSAEWFSISSVFLWFIALLMMLGKNWAGVLFYISAGGLMTPRFVQNIGPVIKVPKMTFIYRTLITIGLFFVGQISWVATPGVLTEGNSPEPVQQANVPVVATPTPTAVPTATPTPKPAATEKPKSVDGIPAGLLLGNPPDQVAIALGKPHKTGKAGAGRSYADYIYGPYQVYVEYDAAGRADQVKISADGYLPNLNRGRVLEFLGYEYRSPDDMTNVGGMGSMHWYGIDGVGRITSQYADSNVIYIGVHLHRD